MDLSNDKILSMMKLTASMFRLEKEKHDTLCKLVRTISMKGRTGTLDEIDHYVAAFEYATGIKDRYNPGTHLVYNRHSWPTHIRDHDLEPVRIGQDGTVYGFYPKRGNIGRVDDEPKVSYTSIKEMRGELDASNSD